ncbi:MAG TPA: hypothetical protein P5160_09075, partial [Candidatus Omnitrophota bacterium]|nr:hypothetical protein [Candidatus Omnitrophota bacterium]
LEGQAAVAAVPEAVLGLADRVEREVLAAALGLEEQVSLAVPVGQLLGGLVAVLEPELAEARDQTAVVLRAMLEEILPEQAVLAPDPEEAAGAGVLVLAEEGQGVQEMPAVWEAHLKEGQAGLKKMIFLLAGTIWKQKDRKSRCPRLPRGVWKS